MCAPQRYRGCAVVARDVSTDAQWLCLGDRLGNLSWRNRPLCCVGFARPIRQCVCPRRKLEGVYNVFRKAVSAAPRRRNAGSGAFDPRGAYYVLY